MVRLSLQFKMCCFSFSILSFSFALFGQRNPADSARSFLIDQMDRCNKVTFVYSQGNDACNVFIPHGEGDVNSFKTIKQQFRQEAGTWESNGLLFYKPTLNDTNGYASWSYTWGENNFGQFAGFNVGKADSLVFYLKGKGVIEVVVGGTNRPPFRNSLYQFQDGVDARSTGLITLRDTGWVRHVLYLKNQRFWVYQGPKSGINNRYSTWAKFVDPWSCSEYLHVSLDSTDEKGRGCIAVTWQRPDSIIRSRDKYLCYGGFGLLSPNINVENWLLKASQGYDLKGLRSICFYAKMTKKGWIEINFNSNECPGGKRSKYSPVDTIWKKYCWDLPDTIHFSKANLGFGIALIPIDRGPITPDSVTLFLDSIYYEGVQLKTNYDSLITGFKIVVPASKNPDSATVQFKNVYFNHPRLEDPVVPQSFVIPTDDPLFLSQQMTGHTYDAALVAIALLAQYYKAKDTRYLAQAERIGEAFLYAQKNDRYFKDGRLRNVYSAGLLHDINSIARISGYWNEDSTKWVEDVYDVSTATGNIAWAALAIISLYEATSNPKYLESAEILADWCIKHTKDDRGFNAGYEGFDDSKQKKLLYTATEHCIDLYAVFIRLYDLTKKEKYLEEAKHADVFVKSMWDDINGKFFTGTYSDGTGINKSVIPTDLQPWYLFAYNDRKSEYKRGYYWAKDSTYIQSHRHPGDQHVYKGFDFSLDTTLLLDGIGYEFTCQMAAAACWLGDVEFYKELIEEVEFIQSYGPRNNRKGIIAACHDGVTTGFNWQYHNILHTGGATCWYLFAKEGINPYYNPNVSFANPKTELKKGSSLLPITVMVSPNPSAGQFSISFSLTERQQLNAIIMNLSGKIVNVLASNQDFQPGSYQFRFDGQELSSGIYFLSVFSAQGQVNKKIIKY